jgi:hypothetical protein
VIYDDGCEGSEGAGRCSGRGSQCWGLCCLRLGAKSDVEKSKNYSKQTDILMSKVDGATHPICLGFIHSRI